MSMDELDVLEQVQINTEIKPPNLYCIVYLNDPQTSSVFVAQSLIDVFKYEITAAIDITNIIDKKGKATVASGLPKEIAEHLRDVVISMARNQKYPLQVEAQPE